jgi:hypothetical protein
MTTAEKLRAMEVIWADLCKDETAVESPAWHEGVLRERAERVKSGEEKFMDWEVAKKELKDRRK